MEIRYTDDVSLKVNITGQMIEDWREHCALAEVPGGAGKDCNTCSLNIDLGDNCWLCCMRPVQEELNRLAGLEADG